jgi:hypothetical protein
VLIVPEENYRLFDESTLGQVGTWVAAGGKLIVIANALNAFVDHKGFALKKYARESEKRMLKRKIKS